MTLSKEQIEAIQARAEKAASSYAPEAARNIAALCQQALRAIELEAAKESLFKAIQHGDDEHRAWLKAAIDDHFAGRVPHPPAGSGRKEAEIQRLQSELTATRKALEEERERCAKAIEDLDCPEHLWEDEARGWDRGQEDSAKVLRALPSPQVKP